MVEQTGAGAGPDGRRARRHALPRPDRPGVLLRRAGPALDRVRARLPAVRPPVRGLHRSQPATRGWSSTGGRAPTRSPPTRRAGECPARGPAVRQPQRRPRRSSAPTTSSTSASATAARRATRTETARTSERCSARSSASTRGPRGGRPYSVPGTNPFVDQAGARPEIYSLRPAQPVAVLVRPADRATLRSATWARTAFEEVDLVPRGAGRGANFGWSAYEGFARFNEDQTAPDAVPPVLAYSHDEGCSVTGGYVVRDRSLPYALRPLPVRRLLRRPAAQLPGGSGPARHRRPRPGRRGPVADLVRGGRRRTHLRDVAGRARLPARRRRLTLRRRRRT